MYFNTTTNEMKVWSGSAWLNAYASLSGALLATNNLSDLNNTATARDNLGVEIGVDVQAYDAQLADIAGLTPSDNNFIVGNGTNFVTESGSTARTSLGLGSIATQDSSNVTVTGGSINGTTIGASTASTGKFTTLEATGVTTVQAGTASAPAITTSGDTNTGIFFPAADTIAFSEGGVESMRLDSNGRLGIGTTSPTTPLQVNGTITATSVNTNNTFGFKNRIINGAMVIDQRNAGASVTPANTYTLDRWFGGRSQASKYTAQQSSVAPAGFTNSLLITSSSAYSVGANDFFLIRQSIEGFNTADLAFGTANAKTVTLSFWVRSSLTGTFGGALENSASDRCYPFSYTINSADTWEQKSITIAGDTTGTWLTTNGIGIKVTFSLGMGSNLSGTAGAWVGSEKLSVTGATSVVGTNGATFYITGVQLEVGSTATSFDYRPYGTELQLCQRYLPAFSGASGTGALGTGQTVSTTAGLGTIPFPVVARVPPTGITISSAGHFAATQTSGSGVAYTGVVFNSATVFCGEVYGTGASGLGAAGGCTQLRLNSTSALLLFTGCEL